MLVNTVPRAYTLQGPCLLERWRAPRGGQGGHATPYRALLRGPASCHGCVVLAWINGPFGVGKTSVAAALRDRTPGSLVFDPEHVGYVVQRLPLVGTRGRDFQDSSAWRRWTRRAALVLDRSRRGLVIVPMTLVNESYFEEIVGGLRRASVDVRHFTLTASAATIRERLRKRGGAGSWTEHQLDRCLSALRDERFARFVSTEARAIDEIAGELSALLSASS